MDARANLCNIARVVGWSAGKHTGRSRPTLARIRAATGLSLRTVQRWTRWLEHRGYLAVLEPGTTPDFRPGILPADAGNLAREWRLALPVVHGSGTPAGQDPDLRNIPTQARAKQTPEMARRDAPDSPPPPPHRMPQMTYWPPGQNPQRRRERLAAADSLRRDLPVLRVMSAAAIASVCRLYWAAGWTVGDVRHALDHDPNGVTYLHTEAVRSPARWFAYRLGRWRSADGEVLPGHSAQLATRAEAHRAGQAARREQLAEARAQVADYPAQASIARAMLRQALARSRNC